MHEIVYNQNSCSLKNLANVFNAPKFIGLIISFDVKLLPSSSIKLFKLNKNYYVNDSLLKIPNQVNVQKIN